MVRGPRQDRTDRPADSPAQSSRQQATPLLSPPPPHPTLLTLSIRGSLISPSSPTSCSVNASKVTRASEPPPCCCTAHPPEITTSQSPSGPSPRRAAVVVRSAGSGGGDGDGCPAPPVAVLLLLLPLLLVAPSELVLLGRSACRLRPCRMSDTPTPGSRLAASSACAAAVRVTYVPLLA